MAKTNPKAISDDIYIGFVQSLFTNPAILLVGASCHGLLGALVYVRTGEFLYGILALCMFAAGFFRFWMVRRVEGLSIADLDQAIARERQYILLGTLQGASVGAFAFAAFYIIPDVFAELAALSAALGGAITIAGRNYGSRKMVMILSVTAVVPISLGLMLKGDVFNFLLGLLIFPFMFITSKMADLVRTVLFTAIDQSMQSTKLAQQFDRALNTMPDGLIMFDNSRRVVVANMQTAEALGFITPERMAGRTLLSLLLRAVAAGLLGYKEARYTEAQLARALQEKRERKILVSLNDGRHFELSARGGSNELAVVTFEDITNRVAAEQKIQHMARYDLLTGLPNRAYFNELVHRAMEAGDAGRPCAVVIFDLDDFKTINDTLGHPIGDGLLYAIGQRFTSLVGEGAFVCRFGGDEFMLYLDEPTGEAELKDWLEGMLRNLDQSVDIAGHRIRFQMSAGAVLGSPAKDNLDGMIARADLALYKAKEHGKNGWHLFEASLDEALRQRQLMRAELREALANRGLHIVYQPIVALGTMRIDSCEALCRWQSDVLGTVPPALFIPLAEEMGIISEITAFVLNAACEECSSWPAELSVSVNLSARDFGDGSIVDVVKSALQKTGLAPHRLELEITETAVLQDKGATAELLDELKALGVRIALDDFGTGYSSLSYLHRLPLDKIKIDRSFLIDVNSSERSLELIKGVVALSKALGLQVTVEGAETTDQLKMLSTSIKPDFVQGFVFGSALSSKGVEAISRSALPLKTVADRAPLLSAVS